MGQNCACPLQLAPPANTSHLWNYATHFRKDIIHIYIGREGHVSTINDVLTKVERLNFRYRFCDCGTKQAPQLNPRTAPHALCQKSKDIFLVNIWWSNFKQEKFTKKVRNFGRYVTEGCNPSCEYNRSTKKIATTPSVRTQPEVVAE